MNQAVNSYCLEDVRVWKEIKRLKAKPACERVLWVCEATVLFDVWCLLSLCRPPTSDPAPVSLHLYLCPSSDPSALTESWLLTFDSWHWIMISRTSWKAAVPCLCEGASTARDVRQAQLTIGPSSPAWPSCLSAVASKAGSVVCPPWLSCYITVAL